MVDIVCRSQHYQNSANVMTFTVSYFLPVRTCTVCLYVIINELVVFDGPTERTEVVEVASKQLLDVLSVALSVFRVAKGQYYFDFLLIL